MKLPYGIVVAHETDEPETLQCRECRTTEFQLVLVGDTLLTHCCHCESAGKKPFGRTFNHKTVEFEIQPDKNKMVEDIAARYLAGDKMEHLAAEYGVNHSNLHRILTKKCGVDWSIKFDVPSLNINETVRFKIPRLLPEATIKAIQKKAKANRTYCRTPSDNKYFKHKYLLSGMIFCEHCDYAMTGQPNHNLRRYRHAHSKREKPCPCKCKRTMIDAELIEANVINELFEMFGNPKAVERAIDAAVPNRAKVEQLRNRQAQLEKTKQSAESEKQRIVRSIAKGTLTDEDAALQMNETRQKIEKQNNLLRAVNDQLSNLPSSDVITDISGEVVDRFQRAMFPTRRNNRKIGLVEKGGRLSAHVWAKVEHADSSHSTMTWEDKRSLLQLVFGGTAPDGKRQGVYIAWSADKSGKSTWRFSIRGLIVKEGVLPFSQEYLADCQMDPDESEWNSRVTKYALR